MPEKRGAESRQAFAGAGSSQAFAGAGSAAYMKETLGRTWHALGKLLADELGGWGDRGDPAKMHAKHGRQCTRRQIEALARGAGVL